MFSFLVLMEGDRVETETDKMKQRLAAVLEALALFGLAALLFWGLRQVEAIRTWEAPFQVRLVEYLLVLLLGPIWLLLFRRNFQRYGLLFLPIRYHLSIFAAAFLPVFLLSVALTWIPWQRWPGTALIALIEIGLLALAARLLRSQPELSAAALLPVMLLIPLGAGNLGAAMGRLGTAYLLVAPAEEALFRGCIQSRLNLAFGRPFCTWGIRWGWGLVIAALLFGFWHLALNPSAASAGPQALWTFFAGLIFGIVREKSGSVAAPALLHGVLNYGPQALLYDIFLSL